MISVDLRFLHSSNIFIYLNIKFNIINHKTCDYLFDIKIHRKDNQFLSKHFSQLKNKVYALFLSMIFLFVTSSIDFITNAMFNIRIYFLLVINYDEAALESIWIKHKYRSFQKFQNHSIQVHCQCRIVNSSSPNIFQGRSHQRVNHSQSP